MIGVFYLKKYDRFGFVLTCLIIWFTSCSPLDNDNPNNEQVLGESIRICTYNIRGDNPNDGINIWKNRKDSLSKLIMKYSFDVIGMQEAVSNQLLDIMNRVQGYSYIVLDDLYNPILYKNERVELLEWDTFWLSESMTPHVVGWDAKYERYCTWAKFKDKINKSIFYVFNTHLDHIGKIAQKEGASLIVKQMKKIAQQSPVFVIGDMNSYYLSDVYISYTESLSDSYSIAKNKMGPIGTGHRFGKVDPVRIDYIFVNNYVFIQDYVVVDEAYENGLYPSDHYPVYVNAKF